MVKVTPSVQAVEVTLTAKFTATVTGLEPFTYQWQRRDQILINETKNTYIIYNASYEDQMYYRCLVTNNFEDFVASNRVWIQITSMYISKHVIDRVLN